MNKSNTTLYLAHSKPGSYLYKETTKYLERFSDVEIRGISENPISPPKFVEEMTFLWLLKAMESGVERDFLEAIQKAEQEGYGAAVCASIADFSLAEAKAKYSIPYLGMGWACYWKAIEIGGKFSHLHTHLAELMTPLSVQQIKTYGFSEKLVSVEYVDVDIYKYIAIEEEPNLDNFIEIFMPKIKACAEKGAKAITIGCGSPELSKLAHMLNTMAMQKYGVRVLPPIDTVVEVAREFRGKKQKAW